ncbi:MAG TPA: DUF2007 domain-containing protein [Allosphingosinicella sp.]|nr:DUF2007 domain-containing protein [Allosphingosinicella sp.]
MALVEAARFGDSFEAGLAKARLEDEGIMSFLFGLDTNPIFAGGLFNIQLMVDEDDFAAARAILSRPGEDGSG